LIIADTFGMSIIFKLLLSVAEPRDLSYHVYRRHLPYRHNCRGQHAFILNDEDFIIGIINIITVIIVSSIGGMIIISIILIIFIIT